MVLGDPVYAPVTGTEVARTGTIMRTTILRFTALLGLGALVSCEGEETSLGYGGGTFDQRVEVGGKLREYIVHLSLIHI